MKAKQIIVIPLVVCAVLICGCTSVGSHTTPTSGTVNKAVFLEPVPAELAIYSPEIISFLQSKGFILVENQTGDCLHLKITFEPDPFHRVVQMELLESERPVVVSQAVNSGWGTVIASGAATANLAESAFSIFKTQCSAWLKGVTLREPMQIPGTTTTGRSVKGFGTGFFVTPDGRVLTAYHVVKGASHIAIKLPDGTEHDAEVDKVDLQNDLAVLRTKQPTTEFLELESAKVLSIGQTVYTLGFPAPEILGEQVKFTGGQVSSLSGIQGSESLLQVTVPVQPGNSGGPLLTEDGKVVGIITSTAAFQSFVQYTGSLPQNVNWAVKADYAQMIFDKPSTDTKLDSKNKTAVAKTVCLIVVE
jgi:S1-C subfamily serine protease